MEFKRLGRRRVLGALLIGPAAAGLFAFLVVEPDPTVPPGTTQSPEEAALARQAALRAQRLKDLAGKGRFQLVGPKGGGLVVPNLVQVHVPPKAVAHDTLIRARRGSSIAITAQRSCGVVLTEIVSCLRA